MTVHELQQEILRLKREKNICILAHAYQSQPVLEVADYTGDSYGLSVQAAKTNADGVIMCGVRFMAETFLAVDDPGASVVIEPDPDFGDGFDYLDGMDFANINRAAEKATIQAHAAGGVPCMVLRLPRIDERTFGLVYYFFMVACALSGRLLGVDPFDQEGVEEYKRSMFAALGKPGVKGR